MANSELLCTDVDSIALAGALGADRIELCAALEVGGVTPGPGLLHEAVRVREEQVASRDFEVVVLVRPRRGDFVYSSGDFAAAVRDVEAARAAGADGVALGVLLSNGDVDLARTGALLESARPMKVTFHRALDHAADIDRAVDALVGLGVDRLLTSGGAPSAWEGRAALAGLVARLAGAAEVVAAGGVHGGNAAAVLDATGAPAIHGSCSKSLRTAAGELGLGRSGAPSEGERATLDESSARAFVDAARAARAGP